MAKRHVLLGGGTGFIGSGLSYYLKSKGHSVTVVSRMPGTCRITWLDVSSCGLPPDVTDVVNLAGQNVLDPTKRWTPGFKQNVINSRVNTTLTLANAIKSAQVKPRTFITMSGVGIYKPDPNEVYNESSDVSKPFDFLSQLALDWESAAQLDPALGVRQVCIRSGVVLGRSGGMIKQMYIPFFFGLGGPIGTGKQFMPWIHLEDLCALIEFAMENENVKGAINGVAPEIVTNEEFTRKFASVLRRPAPFRVPTFALNLLFNEERAKIMTEGQKVLPSKAPELGFTYKYPDIDSAIRQCAKLFPPSVTPGEPQKTI